MFLVILCGFRGRDEAGIFAFPGIYLLEKGLWVELVGREGYWGFRGRRGDGILDVRIGIFCWLVWGKGGPGWMRYWGKEREAKGSKGRGGLHGTYGKEEREYIHCRWH